MTNQSCNYSYLNHLNKEKGDDKKMNNSRITSPKRGISLLCSAILIVPLLLGGSTQTVNAEDTDLSEPLAFTSAQNYGGTLSEAFNEVALTKSANGEYDGGFVAVGYSFGASTDPQWDHLGTSTYNDAIVVKFDANYNVEWSKNYGTSKTELLLDVDVLTDGTIIAAGYGTNPDTNNVDGYLLKINPDDPEDYQTNYLGGSAGDYLHAVEATSDGGYVVGGRTSSLDSGIWDKTTSKLDGAIAKYNSNGDLEFSSLYNKNSGIYYSYFYDIKEDSSGNIIAVGKHQVAKNIYNAQIVKFNGNTGELQWAKSCGSNLESAPVDKADYHTSSYESVAVLDDGSYVAIGTATSDSTTEEGWDSLGTTDGIIVCYNTDGSVKPTKNVGTIDGEVDFQGVVPTSDGGYLVFGSTPNVVIEDTEISEGYEWSIAGSHDGLLLKYNADQSLSWSKTYGTSLDDYFYGFAFADNGDVIAVGESRGDDGKPSFNNNGGTDAIVYLYDKYSETEEDETLEDAADVVYKDGEYTDTANGYNNKITVKVTVSNGAIHEISVEDHAETEIYFESALKVIEKIISSQTTNVDVISGATLSSTGIKNAVSKALSQAAAANVVDLISAIGSDITSDSADTITTARTGYDKLGTYARTFVTNYEVLTASEDKLAGLQVSNYNARASFEITEEEEPFIEDEDSDTHSDIENSNAEGYLFKLADGVEAPSENSKFEHIGADIYIANSKDDIYSSFSEDQVEYVEENRQMEFFDDQSDTYYQWEKNYLNNINGQAFWDMEIDSSGIKIAVIDSGLTSSHQDIDYDHILAGYDYDSDTADTSDAVGHGTQVIGILSAISNNNTGIAGLVSGTDVVPLKVSSTSSADLDVVVKAIYEAVDTYEVQVINLSLGFKTESEVLNTAITHAIEKNVIVVASAGNDGTDELVYPAACDGVIGVGAVDVNNTVRSSSQKNDSVFVTAPGENIYTTVASRRAKCTIVSGTSYSAPFVTAMAAAGKSANADMTVDEFKLLLQNTCIDAGDSGYDTSYGHGIIDVQAFLSELQTELKIKYQSSTGENLSEETSVLVNTGAKYTISAPAIEGYEITEYIISNAADADKNGTFSYDNAADELSFKDIVSGETSVTYIYKEVSSDTTHTVKYETNGGTSVSPVTVAHNEVISEPAAPTREGYTFEGWYTDINLTEEYDFNSKVTSSFTLYAKWTKLSSLSEPTETDNNSSGSGSSSSGSKSPHTGDSNSAVPFFIAIISSIIVIMLLSRRRFKRI